MPKVREGEHFNRRNTLKYFEEQSRLGVIESDAEIEQKWAF
ncbi:hypothetical protein PITCH_A190010 [uncultured Desulfobacterium sp.]|uniref:Uncharacterized protein n=1 Tax=uncultured Desulfobacterium sp. TaxID=201089 RepID=A0A445MV94_9BACT|nr:hypothetical protein PITCH_A190010 [uncultured Desulfobacterium sp.]